jgi:hypothetical protein
MLLFISRNVLIQQVIRHAGQKVVYRAPYYAVEWPIEFVFNTLQQALAIALHQITDENGLGKKLGHCCWNRELFKLLFADTGSTRPPPSLVSNKKRRCTSYHLARTFIN